MRPDPDKVFDTRDAAHAASHRRNEQAPELGYSPWYVGGPVDGKWWVVRAKGVMEEDVEADARTFEEAWCAALKRGTDNHDAWAEIAGIRFEDTYLEGEYPDTAVVQIFRPVASTKLGFGQPSGECRFGIRWSIWPAESRDPEEATRFHDVYLQEFLGTNRAAYERLRGVVPCDPEKINWLA